MVTDIDGVVISVVGASNKKERVGLQLPTHILSDPLELDVAPNEEWSVRGGRVALARSVPFTPPF